MSLTPTRYYRGTLSLMTNRSAKVHLTALSDDYVFQIDS